ncbi:MAG: UDP-N-acetylmuramate--L-alanine ligase, partial [Chloroflexi bacterium]|nr:UDP-N-acetylmuramate--L-alanine ligase [Chloroflexota bacterium]
MMARAGGRVHFVGVGGTGMSGLALLTQAEGCTVSGCDLQLSAVTDDLVQRGIRVFPGHDFAHADGIDLLVVSSAVLADNPDVIRARARAIPVVKRAELLGELTRRRRTLAIAGTHGKTTTTAMLTLILTTAGLDPGALVGGVVPELGSGARVGRGPHLVVEADEFDGSFLRFSPWVAVITNVEADHLDYYHDLAAIEEAFGQFASLVPRDGRLIVCGEQAGSRRCAARARSPSWTYGFGDAVDWQAADVQPNARGGNDFTALYQGAEYARLSLRIPGRHNVLNALAATAASHVAGAGPEAASRTLATFDGVRRRFELKGMVGGVAVYDDYAHHPTEIAVVLQAARERRPRRLVVLFQPHTYNRTRALFADFVRALSMADRVVVADIYMPAGRE